MRLFGGPILTVPQRSLARYFENTLCHMLLQCLRSHFTAWTMSIYYQRSATNLLFCFLSCVPSFAVRLLDSYCFGDRYCYRKWYCHLNLH